jgi:TonB family protein
MKHELLMTGSGPLLHTVQQFLLHYLTHSAVSLTIVCAVAWLGDRLLRRAGPQARHRMWVTALLIGFAVPLLPAGLLTSCFGHAGASDGVGTVTITYRAIVATAGLWTVPPLLYTIAALAYVLTVLLAMARLLWRWRRAGTMARRAAAVPLDASACRLLADAARSFGVAMPEVRCSAETRGPVVLSFPCAMLLVPEGFFGIEDVEGVRTEDVAAALAHECAHLARRDFAKNLIYECVAAAVAYHPACWLLLRRIGETRELVCDEMAAAALGDRPEYAASLLRLATAMAASAAPGYAGGTQAIGVFDANILEERIMRLTMDVPKVTRTRKIAMAALTACALLGGAATAMALSFDLTPQDSAASPSQEKVYEVGDGVTPPVLTHSVDAEFPKAQRKAGKKAMQGVSVVGLIVDSKGRPQDIHINRSLAPDFDKNAMDAVRQYRFEPGKRDAKPVAVSIQIEVNFRRY